MTRSTHSTSTRTNPAPGANSTDRGVSDVVAFVLTFSIIIASVAIVTTTGVSQLTELRNDNQLGTAERSMQAAATELDRLQRGDPSATIQLPLNDANVWVNETEVELNVSTSDDDGWDDSRNFTVNSLEQRFDRSPTVSIIYESGAVMRTDSDSIQTKPEWYVDNGTAIVTVVNLTTAETINVAGGGFTDTIAIGPREGIPQRAPVVDPDSLVTIVADTNATRRTAVEDRDLEDGVTANVTVDVSRTADPDQWEEYLEDSDWEAVSGQNYTFRAVDVEDAVLIRETTIEFS